MCHSARVVGVGSLHDGQDHAVFWLEFHTCRFILMEADTTPTPWSKICISHADCILLVGAGTANPEVCTLQLCSCLAVAVQSFVSRSGCNFSISLLIVAQPANCKCAPGPLYCFFSLVDPLRRQRSLDTSRLQGPDHEGSLLTSFSVTQLNATEQQLIWQWARCGPGQPACTLSTDNASPRRARLCKRPAGNVTAC